jgi:CRISPR-associated protein Cmr2
MTAHLLTIAIGPVQEFIAAARRTRDLWFGSFLLSEISKAAARAVQDHGGHLIFPAPHGEDLQRGSALNVANIILAEVHNHDPEPMARSVKEAAQLRWKEFASAAHFDNAPVLREDVWKEQVDDVVEVYSAWVPFTAENYAAQRQRLVRLLAGRKNCRDFQPGNGRDGLLKSSLDGLRETVLGENRASWPARFRRGLRVREGEQLDVVGLVKRTAEGHKPYPSVSRIAADPWLRGIATSPHGPQVLQLLRDACADLESDSLLHRINVDRLHTDYQVLPYEGTALYRTRHHELRQETGADEMRFAELSEALRSVERHAFRAGLGAEPNPYLAVLVADGDQMGKALSQLRTPDQHRAFSRELSRFAGDAETIVCKYRGVLVYSGGDDVLAFLPVDQCLDCARELYTAFRRTMEKALDKVSVARPTLSVGLAVGHFLEDLEDLLGYGRVAEKAAKHPDRNGLAVHLHKRGGAPVKVRRRWTESPDSPEAPDAHLQRYARWFLAGTLSNRSPYELDRLAEVYRAWPRTSQDEKARLAEAIRCDAVRVIERKRPSGAATGEMQSVRDAIRARVENDDQLRLLAAELAVAREIAVALRQNGQTQAAAATQQENTA